MNPTYYFGIIVRLFAIALFIYGASRLQVLLDFVLYSEGTIGISKTFHLIGSILPIFISIILWFFPLTFARKVLPVTNEEITPISSLSLLTIFVLAIGTYTLYYAIIDSIYWITIVHIFVTDEFGNIFKTLSNQDKTNILTTAIQFGLSIILVARARTISCLLMKFAK